jgi:hypothetical protein
MSHRTCCFARRAFSIAIGATALIAVSLAAPQSADLAPARTAEAPKIALPPLTSAITRAEIEAHVRYLASDRLLGRRTGSPEADEAARYLALVLEREGIEPAGADHTFLQPVALERERATALPELVLHTRDNQDIRAVAGRDFDFHGPALSAKDLHLVVAADEGAVPKTADKHAALFIDANASRMRRWLESAGLERGQAFGLLVRPGSTQPGSVERLDSRGGAIMRKTSAPAPGTLVLRGPLIERVRKGEIASLSFESHVSRESVTSYNVIGRIRGQGTSAHPELASQAIVVSAHYDHLGESHEDAPAAPKSEPSGDGDARKSGAAPTTEDHIYNGADDDASGCAAVLEIAGAIAAGAKPARTILFLFATGEEIGLLGTDEYLDHPVVPLASTIANLNFEMIGRPDPLVGANGAMWLTGYERTNLGPAFAAAGLAIKPDPRPEQHFYERSDNIAFVRRGIVGQTFSSFNLHADYHRVTDEADRIDYAHMEACVQSGCRAVKLVADGALAPEWIETKRPAATK